MTQHEIQSRRRQRWMTASRIRSMSTITVSLGSILWFALLQRSFIKMTILSTDRRMLEESSAFHRNHMLPHRPESVSNVIGVTSHHNRLQPRQYFPTVVDDKLQVKVVGRNMTDDNTKSLHELNIPQWMKGKSLDDVRVRSIHRLKLTILILSTRRLLFMAQNAA